MVIIWFSAIFRYACVCGLQYQISLRDCHVHVVPVDSWKQILHLNNFNPECELFRAVQAARWCVRWRVAIVPYRRCFKKWRNFGFQVRARWYCLAPRQIALVRLCSSLTWHRHCGVAWLVLTILWKGSLSALGSTLALGTAISWPMGKYLCMFVRDFVHEFSCAFFARIFMREFSCANFRALILVRDFFARIFARDFFARIFVRDFFARIFVRELFARILALKSAWFLARFFARIFCAIFSSYF